MDTTGSMRKSNLNAVFALLVASLLPPTVVAAEVGGGVRVGVSYTDNVSLATTDEVDDVVYRASTNLRIDHESPNLDANLNYAFNWYKYSDLDSTSKYHRGEASVTAKAWQESFLTTFGVSRRQTIADPDDVLPSGRLPRSGNLVDQDEWWVNPRLTRVMGNSVTLSANYRFSDIDFDREQTQGNQNQSAVLTADNYRAAQGLTWRLNYNWRRTEYDDSDPWEFQQASAELGYWISSGTRIFGSGGKETAWDDPLDPSMEDSFWEAGFAHAAGDKLSAEFAAGERSFGSSWRGQLDYSFRRGTTSISYSETPTTTGYNRGASRQRVDDPDEFDDFLDQPGSDERYLAERLQWSLNLAFRRSNFRLLAFDEDRTGRVTAGGTLLDDQSQTGVRAGVNRQLGVRTEISFSGAIIDRDTGNDQKSKYIDARLDVTYRLGSRSDVSFGYTYAEEDPRGQESASNDYFENVYSLSFAYRM